MNSSSAMRDSRRRMDIAWGYMLENAMFVLFSPENQAFIEREYLQCKIKTSEAYVTIQDANLPFPHTAKVYIGVDKNHLRMPGTRYHVHRIENPAHPQPFTATFNPSRNHSKTALFSTYQSSKTTPSKRRNAPAAIESVQKLRKTASNNKAPIKKRKTSKNHLNKGQKESVSVETSIMPTPATLALPSPETYTTASVVIPSPTETTITVPYTDTSIPASITTAATNLYPLITDPALVAILSSPGASDDSGSLEKNTGFEPLFDDAIYASSLPTTQQHQEFHTVNPPTTSTAATNCSAGNSRYPVAINNNQSTSFDSYTDRVMSTGELFDKNFTGQHQHQRQWSCWSTAMSANTITPRGDATPKSLVQPLPSQENNHTALPTTLTAMNTFASTHTTIANVTTNAESNNDSSPQQKWYNPPLHEKELYGFMFNPLLNNHSYRVPVTSNNSTGNSATIGNSATVSWCSYVPITYLNK